MAKHSPIIKKSHIQAAVALCIVSSTSSWAQQNPTEITITDKLPSRVSGFGEVAAKELPFNTTTISSTTLQEIGAQRLSDALRLDASVSDSYNSPAYWDSLSVRGFTLNNRYNYQREGLPISAETMIPMDNKERIELLKGTSGMQAGTSSPGGLVNYMIKRAPTMADQSVRNVTLSYGQGNNRLIAADLGGRFGEASEFGYRFNVAHEALDPYVKNTKGHRDLVALAMDWRLNANSKLEWEIENSHREQMGLNAYSLLGNALPAPVNGTRNITYQPWSQPGVFDALTGSVRLKHNLDNGWQSVTQYGVQRLRMDDRLSFAFGCSAENSYNRYCSNGSFDLYDYRSENERRTTEALQTELSGSVQWVGLKHDVSITAMRYRQLNRLSPKQAYNYAGTGNVDGGGSSAAASVPADLNTDRSDYTNELGLKDRVHLNAQTSGWFGLRHVQLNRQSAKTDGSQPEQDLRNVTTPWLALSHALNPTTTVYASYGQGIETEVTPNKSNTYVNAGKALPALRSKQYEVGLKGQTAVSHWQITGFDITRPAAVDAPAAGGLVVHQIDGENRHRGIELSGDTSLNHWRLGSGFTWIDAKRQNASIDPQLNGQRPLNVPSYVLRGMAEYRYATEPGLRTGLRVSHEGKRGVTEQNNGNISLPAWTTLDLLNHYDTKINNVPSTMTFAVDNVLNKQYWRESPKQYDHYYLYPGAPRTFRATLQMRLSQ